MITLFYIYIYILYKVFSTASQDKSARTHQQCAYCYATNEYVINHRDFARCFPFGDEIDGVCLKANQVKRECARVVGSCGFEGRVKTA